MVNNDYFFYQTPDHEFQQFYGDVEKPFAQKVKTQLPQNVALIRIVATLILSAWALTKPVWVWPVAVAGVAYAGWTVYANFIKKDPLVELFYEIVGDEEEYQKLPEIKLTAQKPLSHELKDLDWDAINAPLSRAVTEDGRRILIVKALTRHADQNRVPHFQVNTVLAFVEKLSPFDCPRPPNDIFPENNYERDSTIGSIFESFLQAMAPLVFTTHEPHDYSYHFDSSVGSKRHEILASMNPEIANELQAQA